MGVSSVALFKDYLSGREQRVKTGDTFSKWKGYTLATLTLALENCICREVRVANEWYRNNRMIVNETKHHQAIVLGKTGHSFSVPIKRFFGYI